MNGYENYEPPKHAAGGNARAVLLGQVQELRDAEALVADLEADLKEAKNTVLRYLEELIPDTLEDMGLEEAVVDGGLKVSVKSKVHASPRAGNRDAVYDWLEENNHGGIVKRKGIIDFGKTSEEDARATLERVEGFRSEFQRKVEPATLTKFVADMLEQGVEIPLDLFGAYTRRVATVKTT